MRWRDDNAVGEVVFVFVSATSVVNENGSRDYGSRSYTVVFLDDCLDVVRRQHLECSALHGRRKRVGVFPHVEWAAGSLLSPVVADRLRNCEDVRFGERALQRRTAVSTGAEADQLIGIMQVGMALEIFLLQTSDVDQHFLWRRFASEGRDGDLVF